MFAAATMPNPDNHEMSMTFVSQFVINASDIITASTVQLRTQFVTVPECITYIHSLDATESIVPQSIYDIYSTADTAYAWNIYRTTRMRLHHCMLMLINCALADFAIDAWEAVDNQDIQTLVRRRQEHMEILHSMAQEILSFVPATVMQAVRSKPSSPQAAESIPEPAQRSICWADALRLVWPLATIYKLPMVQEEQRWIARQSCYVIGKQWGIREALKQWSSPVARKPQAIVLGSTFDQDDWQVFSSGRSLTTREIWT
ncbi:hypothetical protein N7510_006811 [Penicillium lagena]|uniref:uncharacterized protein n=1 Tax=Penicillium lagena TaxID=94218 RepID=UPI002540445E|nr:uncharacterized protein N7510_006811 [Penicillium lagena]KAJ5610092.1 hypothetical protein N7510_006811 [Penicillium lagena]